MICCMLLIVAAVVNVNASIHYDTPMKYKLCMGDTIYIDEVRVVNDTIWYDTIVSSTPPDVQDTLIRTTVVNKFPTFLKLETERRIERGTTFNWHGIVISKAGMYEKVYKSVHECDSIYQIRVRERVETHITDTLCLGSSKTFGNQTLTKPGIYRDSLHYADYDSITILSLLGHMPDTVTHDVRIPEGTSFDWNGNSYSLTGVYDLVFTDRFGCDSLSRLVLTVYHVDTIDTAVVVCPGESYTWHGYTGSQTMKYEFPGVRENGDQVWYRFDLTVKPMVVVDTTFTICDDETLTFNGRVYTNPGEYDDQYTCDTLYKITVVKHPTKLHVQTAVLDRTNPYYWRYELDGVQYVDTILAAGTYEHMTHDVETGCNEIYRLIVTKDETAYHYITDTVVCENDYFEWRGKPGLNRQGIGTTTHYFDRYRTVADQDSIYELILRVQPVPRTSQTIKFCGSIEWNGVTYTESTVLVDTMMSMQYHCDSIVTTLLSKGIPFHKHDTATIRPGESITWRGQIISADGQYKDSYVTAAGCDSIYSLGVGLEEVPVATPTRTWYASICEGDYYLWEADNQKYFNGGTYVDTVFNAVNPQQVDSLHILIITKNQKYVTRERITSHVFPTYYRGQEFYRDQEVEFHYTSVNGCDSVVIVKAEFEISHFEENVVICPGESYIWDWDGLTYRETGRYFKTVKDQNGNDSVEHILNLTVKYIPDTYIKKTICKGSSYTYGDRTLTEAGIYDFTFHETGCDSIVHLALNVVSPDTIRYVHHMNEHDSYTWHGETYHETGVHYFHGTNRWGCDSLEILQLTVNHVDTIDSIAVICPNEIPFVWHGITASQSGKFTGTEEIGGVINYYRLDLTVREMVYLDTTFTICGDQTVTFHGVTYNESGTYPNHIACDTIVNVHIVNHPQQVYETHARMTDDHGYHWTYWDNGVKHENVLFNQPGTYEFETPNAETGCSEIWRLILTLDENSYLFQEALTICEGDDFTWQGLSGLSSITGTNTYRVEYETHAGKDSIYELTLTVVPVERTVRTITFCGETEWKGKTYTSSAVVYDTISLASGCYRIERINLDKAQSYYFRESKDWPQGKVLIWHGQNITTDGVYYDRLTTVQGCDSVYELTVTIIPAAPESNQYAEELSTCEGDTIVWRGKNIWRSGTYVDTVWAEGKVKVDSVFTLSFTAWPAPKDTIYEHLYTCNDGGVIRYNGKDYLKNDTVITNYHTIHGCDSVVKTYLHFNEALFLRDTARVAENTLPYAWTPTGTDTTIYLMEPSTYQYKRKTNGGCDNVWELFFEVYPVFILRDSVAVCESELPYHWERGPIEYRSTDLSAEPGTTREVSYSFTSTITGADSVYILQLTVLPQIKKVEQHYFCEGEDVSIYGKTYYMSSSDSVLRDTIMRPNPEAAGCDSIIYLEIYQNPVNRVTETVIMHEGETINWRSMTITELLTKTYEERVINSTGCEDIYQLRVIAEQHIADHVCVENTPYEWRNQYLNTTGLYTDTVRVNNVITEFHSLSLTVDTVPTRYERIFFCEGDQIKVGDKIYHNLQSDSVYRDTLRKANEENLCDSVIYYEITQYPAKHTIETKILHVDSTIVWNGMTITEQVDRTYTYDGNIDPVTGCTITEQLRIVAEQRENKTICVLDTPYTAWRGYQLNTTGIYTDTVFENGFIKEFHSLNLKVDTVPSIIREYYVCAGYPQFINGKEYGADATMRDTLYYDTISAKTSPTSACDSIIYLEIHVSSVKKHTETMILPFGETINWNGMTITKGGDYSVTTPIATGCDSLSILHVVEETRLNKTICITDTPFVWTQTGESYYTAGIWADTTIDAYGHISAYYTLHLAIDTIPTRTIREYVCAGTPRTINNKVYGAVPAQNGQMFRDTIWDWPSSTSVCDSTIFYEIYVSGPTEQTETKVIREGETITWEGETITEVATKTYKHITNDPVTNCEITHYLNVIAEDRLVINDFCALDTPYVWSYNNEKYYTTGVYTDTTFENGFITRFYTLDLTIKNPEEKTIFLEGCIEKGGVTFLDQVYLNDTIVSDTLDCDTIYKIHVTIHRVDTVYLNDTICENDLPYILGRQNPDTIWTEDANPYYHSDTTAYGCDSTVVLTLHITPTLGKNDSTFICEDEIAEHPVVLGNLTNPWFDTSEGGRYHGKWEGKWTGVKYTTDTIVWDCNHEYFHHIIVRPRQKTIPEVEYSICRGDSVQPFWPHNEVWVKTDTVIYDTIPNINPFEDTKHGGIVHNDRAYVCDSITKWTFHLTDTVHEHLYKHIREGETYVFNDSILATTGVYDSIGVYTTMDSAHNYCKAYYHLHLTVDPVYRTTDTIDICFRANREYTYVMRSQDDSTYTFKFQTPDKDTALLHFEDSLMHPSYQHYDHYFNLVVYYRQEYFKQYYDTICEGDSLRFDIHHRDNTLDQRFLKVKGIYYDTIPALNGCDSIIELYFETRDSIPTTYLEKTVSDRELPYIWTNSWYEGNALQDSTMELRETGIYQITMPNVHGCDSTIVMNFTVHQTHVFRDTITVCAPVNRTLSHIWDFEPNYEQFFTVPDHDVDTTYEDTLVTRIINDSIYHLYVHYHVEDSTIINATICEGDSMRFGLTRLNMPRYLKESGTYRDTLVRHDNSCDSIIVLRLNVYPRYFNDSTKHIADVDTPYVWIHKQGGQEIARDSLYTQGNYEYIYKSQFGCDSIDSLHLFIHKTYHIQDDTINICYSETPFTWRELNNITETGDYENRRQTTEGYDSIYYVHINVWKQVYDTIQASICEGDSMRWGLTKMNQPRFVYNAGLYNDTLVSSRGCDSILVLSLNIFPRYFNDSTKHIADVDTPYVWIHMQNGHEVARDSLYAAGRYGFRYESAFGCDSIDSLTLVIHPTYLFKDTVTICYDQTPYTWYNADQTEIFQEGIYETGTYIKRLQTHDLYDSTYVRYVRVIPVIHDTIRHAMCEGTDYLFNGVRYTEGGSYTDTLVSNYGCDSIVTLILTVNKSVYVRIPADIYEGETYMFYGQPYTTSGTYRHYSLTPEGCDSIAELFLTVHPQIDTIVTICKSELPYTWVHKWSGQERLLYSPGIYRDDTTVVNDQRTFYTLQLVVHEPLYDTIRASICQEENDFYEFNGQRLTTTGIYHDTITGSNGCDSITTLYLTVNKPYYNYIERHIVEGQSVEVLGQTYTTDTLASFRGLTSAGCDSITDVRIIMHPLIDTTVVVCSNDLPYRWINKWNGQESLLYAAGLYRNDTTMVNGKPMYYGLQLIVNNPVQDTIRHAMCEGASYEFKGNTYTEAGIYRDTLRAANGCDSIVTLILTVNKPYYNIIKENILEGNSVEFYGTTYSTSGTYTHYARTPEGCDSTTVLQLTVHPLVDTVINVCDNDLPVIWNNRWSGKQESYYTTGLYRNDTTINGEKMFYGIQINVYNQVFDTIRHAMCEGASYEFKGNTYTEAGIYRDTLRAANGCDSIVTLILTVNKPYYNIIKENILEGNSVEFYGTTYSTSGTYTHYARTPEGCDSTTVLQLTVHPLVDTVINVCDNDLPVIWNNRWSGKQESYYTTGLYRNDTTINGEKMFYGIQINVNHQVFDTIRHAMCEGASYEFKGNTYTEAGIYRDTLRAANGCDSIVTLILTVNKPYYNIIKENILEGNSVEFYGTNYNTSGTYTHYARTPEGCDSTTVLQLTVHPLVDTVINVCDNDLPVIWNNRWSGKQESYYTTGLYRNDTTINGEKMFYGIQINVNHQVFDTIRHAMCEGASYEFKGNTYTEAGIYRDTLRAANGCDSIVTLILTVNKPYYNIIKENILEGNSVEFYGTTYSTSGTYTHYARTPEGCDSTTVLQLTVHPLVDTVINVCDNDLPVIWNNRWSGKQESYYTTGLYRNDTTINGEKMFYGIQINVYNQVFDTIRHAMCEGASYEFKGNTYTEAGIYRDTLRAANGCDSIVTLILTVNKPYYNIIKENILEGNSVEFYGTSYNTSGTYTHYARTPEGCDSTTVLQLTVHPLVDTVINVCDNDLPVIWNNRWSGKQESYYTTGLYRNDTTINGEKMFYGIQINVYNQVFDTIRHAMCEGASYEFKGNTYTEAGIYRDTLRAANGCDSIVTLILTVNKPYYNIIKENILEGNSVEFYGTTYSTSGTYTHYARTPEGCDSTTVLQLTVHPLVDTVINVCDNDLPVIWNNRWSGKQESYYTTGLYRNDTTINGEKMFYGIQINVNHQVFDTIRHAMCEGASYEFKGNTYTEAGIYRDTLRAANGCDSIVTLILTVNKPYYNIIKENILEGNSVEFYGTNYNTSGTYTHYARTPEGCDSTTVLQLTVHPLVDTVINVCDNDLPVIWNNRWSGKQESYYTTGLYRNDTTINGEKMFYGIQINVYNQVFDTIRHAMCEGASYEFKGNTYTEAGIYRDTLRAANGCDSIVTLILTVNKPYYNIIKENILEGNSVEFYGTTYSTSGTYTHYARTPEGCDSTTVLQLTVHPLVDTVINVCDNDLPVIWNNRWSGKQESYYTTGLYRNDTTINGEKMFYGIQINVNHQVFDTIRHAMCEGASYEFKGNTYTEAGIYRDTLRAANGCDSIVTLILTVNKPYYNIIKENILEGNSVEFYGTTYSTSGTYTHYARTPEGCDSTTVLQLTVHPLVDTVINVCDNDLPVIWNNRWSGKQESYYTTGLYRNDTTINGEKMFYGIQVNVGEQKFDTTRAAICEGSFYRFKEINLYEQGIYRDTLVAANGCDSIHTLVLTVNKPYYNTIQEDILEGSYFVFYGDTIRESTTLHHSGRTPEGCDSTTILQLTVHPMVDTVVTICSNELPYVWHNRWSGEEEKYYRTGLVRNDTIINGKKLFYGLDLHVSEQVFDTIRHAMCEGSSYEFANQVLYDEGIYRDTLVSKTTGCDSIVTLILTVNKPYYNIIRETILEGQYYVFFGDTIRETKAVTHSTRTPQGCDSTTILELTVHQLVDTVITICSNDLPYVWTNKWNGLTETFYKEGTYRNDTSMNGERYFYGVKLVVRQPSDITIYREICEGSSYKFNGRDLTVGGEYRDTLINTIGCDSVIILNLNVLKTYHNVVYHSIFEGDSVEFQGKYYKTAGNYPFYFTSSYGCDSIIELQLTVNRLYDDSISICANDLPYVWNGKTIYESGIYRDTVVNTQGKETAIGLKVTVLPIAHAPEAIVATICEGDYYKFGDSLLTVQGTYYDTLVAVNGCDSIVMLALQVMPTKHQVDTKTIFEGDTVMFYGDTLTTSGIYTHSDTTENGCANTHQLVLTVLKEARMDTTAYVCENKLPFIWHGYEFNQSGDYEVPTAWTDSSRVVTTLHLIVREAPYKELSISLCYGNMLIVNRDTIKESGTYDYTVPTPLGCDSLIRYIVSVHNRFERWDTAHISDKQSYEFPADDGSMRQLTIPGDYEYTGKTYETACDSIIHLHLVVHPSYYFKDSIEICKSDANYPYVWKDGNDSVITTIYETGTYYNKHLTARYGFDSIYEFKVAVYDSYLIEEKYEIGVDEHLDIHGQDISKPGIYYDNLLSSHGCDSIYKIVVNPKRVKEFTWTKEICQGEYFEFPDGTKLTQTGNYKYVSATKDSVIYLSLNVISVSYTEERIVVAKASLQPCGGTDPNCYSYLNPKNGKLYTDLHVGYNIFDERSASGTKCDNIHRIIIIVTEHYNKTWDQVPLCPGGQIEINGTVITQPGSYQIECLSDLTGEMDSLYRVKVYQAKSYDMPAVNVTICQNELPYIFAGETLRRAGSYTFTKETREGCDSIVRINLSVNPTYHEYTDVTIPDYQKYLWKDGVEYNQTGEYDYVLPTINSCDSTNTLRLTVIPTQRYTSVDTICEGQEYTWRGNTYRESGYFTDTVYRPESFFSAIYTLQLTVLSPTFVNNATATDFCADDKEFTVSFSYSGAKPTTYSIYFDAQAKSVGFQDIINKQLLGEDKIATIPVPQKSDTLPMGQNNYIKPNWYTMRLVFDNGACAPSSVDNIKFCVKYPSWIIEQNWDDVVAPLNKTNNGRYEFSQVEWQIIRTIGTYTDVISIPNNGQGYLHYNDLRVGDEVIMIATRKGENYSIPTCPIVIQSYASSTGNDPTLVDPIYVYPKMAPRHAPKITIEAPQGCEYTIYSSMGSFISCGSMEAGKQEVTLPNTNGIYFIRTVQGKEDTTHKVVLY